MNNNICALRTASILTGIPVDDLKHYLLAHIQDKPEYKELMREITHEEPLGDDVFQVIGILLCIQFNVYIYLSDNERVHVRRFGVDIPHIPGCESVKSYDVRFEPLWSHV